MPCDRDFAKIESARKKKDRVLRPSKWVNMVETVKKKNPFAVNYLQFPLTDNMSDDGHEIVDIYDIRSIADKYVRPKFHFNFSDLRESKIRNNSKPQYRLVMSVNERCFPSNEACGSPVFLAAMGKFREDPKNFLPIKAAKLENVKQLLGSVHVDDDNTFYQNLFTTADAKNDDDQQSDEDKE